MNRDIVKSAYLARSQNFVQGITRWLLITLIISLGFGQLLRFEFSGIPIYLHDIFVVVLLFLQALTCDWRSVLKRNFWLQVKNSSVAVKQADLLGIIGILVFLFAILLSSIRALTIYPLFSLVIPSLYTLRLLSYLLLFITLKKSSLKLSKNIFLISGFVTLSIGLFQYFVFPDMRIFYLLGWDDHLSRLTLPHFDPTFSAVMLALPLFLYPLFAPVFIFAILLTYARSVWLSLFIATLITTKNKYIVLIVALCMMFAIFALPRRFGEGTNLVRTYSISSRFQSDFSYIEKYKWDLLIGRGLNTLILDEASSHATGPNNSYLYLLTTTGLLGLIGWGIFLKHIYANSSYKPLLIFFFISSLFNNVMFYPFVLLWVLMISADIVL